MQLIKLTLILSVVLLASAAEESPKNRGKRQGLSYHPRRIGKPPPYAVQMEPTVRYSQRDPLYNPLASAKSDDFTYEEPLHHHSHHYGPSEPEPIIEIIIKESNETLPTPVPPTLPPSRPTKEPIQVFYVKYEKKEQGDGKSKVIYDTPVPALVPHEEHEEIKDENSGHEPEPVSYVTPAPSKEPTTTLRAIIRPESESYHAGGSGIRVTFGTEQLPPNNHNKRSDLEKLNKNPPPPATPPRPTSRKQHGPSFPPPPSPLRGVPPAFGQSRIVNSFPPHHQLTQNFQGPPHYQGPPQRRPPITIQGLPEVQQRLPFHQSFNQPHRIQISHPQQPGFPPALSVSHQSVHLQSQPPPQFSQGPPPNFNDHAFHQHQVQLYRQQEEEKLRYHQDQRRQQELQRQQEHQRQKDIQRQQEHQRQELQRQKDIQRQQEYHRIKQENQIREHHQQQIHHQQQQQQQQFNQSPNFPPSHHLLPNNRQPEKQSEILKAVPKLEQHYAIRENPHHPGPFPPNAQQVPLTFSQAAQNNYVQQQVHSTNSIGIQSNHGNFVTSTSAPSQSFDPSSISSSRHQTSQQFFSQNLGAAHQQQQQLQHQPQQQLASVWGRPVFKDNKQKIYATPVTHTTPAPPPPTQRPTTTTTTTTTTEAPTTPRNEERIKENIANLPDEVPEDIRNQLLSSGILGNADIQVLDYDKVGGINIGDLPPEALANFYGAGGGGVVSASEPIPSVVKHPKLPINSPKKVTATTNKVEQATLKPGGVEMKVVRFDPNTAQGQAIADQHIREDATQLKPVNVGTKNDGQYNRYLPLKVSGTSFPIPDVPELRDRKITSVVVLAPVDYNAEVDQEIRESRKLGEPMPVKFLAGDSLKQLIKKPSAENYKRWLEQERRSEPQKQSVVLLVTTPKDPNSSDKEIFMYDVTSQTVSKLSGDLSSAFVDAAESNADSHDSIDDSAFAH